MNFQIILVNNGENIGNRDTWYNDVSQHEVDILCMISKDKSHRWLQCINNGATTALH